MWSIAISVISGKYQSKKSHISAEWATIKINKGTLTSQTLNVGEKKVPSEFGCFAYWPRYARFRYLPFKIGKRWCLTSHKL